MMSRGNEQDGRGGALDGALRGHVDDWGELAVDYLDGRSAPETKAAIERHLQACPACAARVETQSSVVRFLQETSLEDPPEDLEYRVLGEILFPSQVLSLPKVAEQPRGPVFWRRKIRPWIPATVAVAALLAAVVGYGLLRSDTDLSTKNVERSDATVAYQDQSAGATSGGPGTLGATTTAAAATTTTAGATIPPASVSSAPAPTQDRKVMVNNLKAAQAPAYIVFEAVAPQPASDDASPETTAAPAEGSAPEGTSGVSPEQTDGVVSQMLAFTGMAPLDGTLALGGPTFAAFVPRDDVPQLVDLVRSIGTSLGLAVSLDMTSPAGAADAIARLLGRKAQFPVLSATRTPQPAVSGYTFTTSTLVPGGSETTNATSPVLPDEAGTHVLVVFYVRR